MSRNQSVEAFDCNNQLQNTIIDFSRFRYVCSEIGIKIFENAKKTVQ